MKPQHLAVVERPIARSNLQQSFCGHCRIRKKFEKWIMETRRNVLKGVIGASLVSGTLPTNWVKPVVNSVVLPVHAQTTPIDLLAPTLSIPDMTIDDHGGQPIFPIDLSAYAGNCGGGCTFSQTGLPVGLSIDPNTGIISGVYDADDGDAFEVEVTITNEAGSATDTFLLSFNNQG